MGATRYRLGLDKARAPLTWRVVDVVTLAPQGALDASSAEALFHEAEVGLREKPGAVRVDLSGAERLDTLGAAWLLRLARRGENAGAKVAFEGAHGQVKELLDMLRPGFEAKPRPPARREPWIERLGGRGISVGAEVREAGDLLVQGLYWSLFAPIERRKFRFGAFVAEIEEMGVRALGIVVLLNFLLGGIVATMSATQLRPFGAEVYVANLVVIAFTRELGPLLTAIIASARTGAAITAELATMKVGEEIDALRSMGVSPVRFLVAPKLWALLVSLPCLTLVGMASGVAGGAVVGVTLLDRNLEQWTKQTSDYVTTRNLSFGLSKAVLFALCLVIIGSHNGLRANGGARGVGLATTRAVVMDVFAIVLVDLVYTVVEWLA